MKRPSTNPEENVFGLSPLGGNSTDGGNTEGVPLFWDDRVGSFISEQAVQELDDRDISAASRDGYNKEQEFLQKIGYKKG
jgi:hypothetical protein